jgi:LysM repeat protein
MNSVANEPLVIGQLQRSGGIMWKLRALILLPILLFACRPINADLPEGTAVPANNDSDMSSDSPRLTTDAPPTATTLPPTWTPRPLESNQPLPQTSNTTTETSNTTTDSGLTVVQGTAVPSYDGPSITYVVKRGDTLAEICTAYTVPITDVARINNLADWDHIEVGQTLIIPSSE